MPAYDARPLPAFQAWKVSVLRATHIFIRRDCWRPPGRNNERLVESTSDGWKLHVAFERICPSRGLNRRSPSRSPQSFLGHSLPTGLTLFSRRQHTSGDTNNYKRNAQSKEKRGTGARAPKKASDWVSGPGNASTSAWLFYPRFDASTTSSRLGREKAKPTPASRVREQDNQDTFSDRGP